MVELKNECKQESESIEESLTQYQWIDRLKIYTSFKKEVIITLRTYSSGEKTKKHSCSPTEIKSSFHY